MCLLFFNASLGIKLGLVQNFYIYIFMPPLVEIGSIVLWLYSSIPSETTIPFSKSFISLKFSSVRESSLSRSDARFRQCCSRDLDIKKSPFC